MNSQAGFVCALVVAVIVLGSKTQTSLTAQAADPSTLPLLSSDSLEYVGGFRVPREAFSYGGHGVAYDPATNTLFVGNRNSVAEVSIPAPVNSSDVNALPFAKLLQPETDPMEGRVKDVNPGDVKAYSFMVAGDKLYGTAYIYFDADNVQRVSHYSRSRNLSQPSFSGWSQVWTSGKSGFVAGYMSQVPTEWQAKLGGAAITGQCCIPIINRTSSGPSAFAFDPSKVGQPTVSATPLLYYPQDHATLGSWSGTAPNPPFNQGTEILGVAVIANTRSVLYFGRTGLGPPCYGEGTSNKALVGTRSPEGGPYCYDPTNHYKATHSYPYGHQVWAYDLNDFAAAKAGKKRPWDVKPYGVWPLNLLPTSESGMMLGGVGYDSQRQLLYVSQMRVDVDGGANRPIIHTLRVKARPPGP